jgi:hypothetical protein
MTHCYLLRGIAMYRPPTFALLLVTLGFLSSLGLAGENFAHAEEAMKSGHHEVLEPYWTAWRNGHDVSQHSIFGIKLYVFGRVGRFLLFVAGLSIVLDIPGEQGLKEVGDAIGAESAYRRAKAGLKGAWQYTVNINRATYQNLPKDETDELRRKAGAYLRRPLTLLITAAMFVLFLWFRSWEILSWYTPLGLFLSVAVAPAVILVGSLILSLPGLLFDLAVIKPLSKLLSKPEAGKVLRVVMLCSLFAGFILDILLTVPA